MDLTKFKSSEPVRNYESLSAGRHDVVITRVAIFKSDRMKDFEGNLKTEEELEKAGVDYDDTQQQLVVIFTGVDEKKNVIHRFNTQGYKRFEELADPTGYFKSTHPEGYAVSQKTRKRVVSKKNSEACKNILDDFFSRCSTETEDGWVPLPTGSTPDDLLNARLSIEVKEKKFNNRIVSPEVQAFRPFGFKAKTNNTVEVPDASSIDS